MRSEKFPRGSFVEVRKPGEDWRAHVLRRDVIVKLPRIADGFVVGKHSGWEIRMKEKNLAISQQSEAMSCGFDNQEEMSKLRARDPRYQAVQNMQGADAGD